MRKLRIRMLALVLCLAMVLSTNNISVAATTVSGNEIGITQTSNETSVSADSLTVEGTDSFGRMFAEAIEEKNYEQQENIGYNIFSIEMNGTHATVSLENLEECILLVAVYNEAGDQLIASGQTTISAGSESADVEIITESMPAYFYLCGYLIEEDSFRPLCTSYESPNYTKEMQDFLAKTTADFKADRVLNLDDDETTNFAVYSESTVVIEAAENTNQMVSMDEDVQEYVIENADEDVMSMSQGDIFVYESENGILIVKVGEIEIEDTSVTIIGADASIEEAFEYIKIDESANTESATVDTSKCEEGVVYNGKESADGAEIEIEGSTDYKMDTEAEGEGTLASSLSFDLLNVGPVNGKVKIEMSAGVKFYLTSSFQYIELKNDYTVNASLVLSDKVSKEIHLGTVGFMPITGVIIEGELKLVLETESSFNVNAALKGTIGVAISSDSGVKNLTSWPKLDAELNGKISAFIGIGFNPRVVLICDEIAQIGLESKAGVEIEGKIVMATTDKNAGQKHSCLSCVDGDFNAKFSLEFTGSILEKWKYTYTITEISMKICDWYFSGDTGIFGIGECPNKSYRLDVLIVDYKGNPAEDVKVYIGDNSTSLVVDDGIATDYFKDGTYRIRVKSDDYVYRKVVEINGMPRSILVELPQNGYGVGFAAIDGQNTILDMGDYQGGAILDDGSLYMWGYSAPGGLGITPSDAIYEPIHIMDNVISFSTGVAHTGAITEDGDLYMWGHNYDGRVGNGTTGYYCSPVKVLENVKSVSAGAGHSAAIMKNGDLYTWGHNGTGQLGNGTTIDSSTPVKIMEDVKTVEAGTKANHSAAITRSGELYMWGACGSGQLGIEDVDEYKEELENVHGGAITEPIKVMENVQSVSLGGNRSAAVTKDGSLYIWGNLINIQQESENGEEPEVLVSSKTPVKVMDNVQTVCLNATQGIIVKEDGSLYVWPYEKIDEETGDREYIYVPTKVLDNVKCVSIEAAIGAITGDGVLYVWGSNSNGQLGDGTTVDKYTPTKLEVTPAIETESVEMETEASRTEHVTASTTTNTQSGTSSFWGLKANATYNFYIMKSKTAEDAFSADNLMYISQVESDATGNISVSYNTKETYTTADAFVVCMEQIDLSGASVTTSDLTYNGNEQYVKITVTLNGKTLVEGEDYDLEGNFSATEVGKYVVTIRGIGEYCGSVDATYSVLSGNSGTVGDNTDTGSDTSKDDLSTGSDTSKDDLPAGPDTWKGKTGTEGFVYRLYNIAMGREADEAGFNDWNNKLKSKAQTATQVAQGFIFSREFLNHNYNNTQYVKLLYRTMFGREADEAGLNNWLTNLENGMSREFVFRGFAESQEFTDLCEKYDVERGTVSLSQYRDKNVGATGFIARLYTKMLGRGFDINGLEYWCKKYHTGENTIEEIATVGFLHSLELQNQNLSDEEFVRRMYQTFLNREPEEAGLKDWVNRLQTGQVTRDSLVYGFTNSEEFTNIKTTYGLE